MTLLPSRPLVVLALCALPAIAGCTASASFQAGGAAQPEAPPPPPPPPPPAPEDPAPAATTPATEAPPAKANTPPARQSKATVRGDVVMLPAAVEFEPGTTTLRAGSEAPLEQLRLFLVENPRVTKLRIEGHTDNTGDAANNEKLSGERALALKKWLVDRGIQKERLIAVGFGQTKPVADNSTEEGRKQNQRVEFRLAELGGRRYLDQDPSGGGKVFE
ncbi:MAG TPA: OmpA family protein [Polyangiaceae bacterium]|nr:OmpA family protein [Polyangiaceae bacterium]